MSHQHKKHRPVITGATDGDTNVGQSAPNRLEFRDFIKDMRLRSLFVRALDLIQKLKFENDFSFPAIGGIHGLPYVRWGYSGDSSFDGSGDDFGGYCTHSSVLFPTWHRPYVALIEQSLYVAVNKAVKEYSRLEDYHEWQQAARNFRMPFWDWALPIKNGEPAVPIEIRCHEILIWKACRGERWDVIGEDWVSNPIQAFTFKSDNPYKTFPAPWNLFKTTLRYPDSDTADAKSNNDKFESAMSADNKQLCSQVYNMLTRLDNWPYFSNDAEKQKPPIANSLETIHDNVHLLIGGTDPYTGHMAYIPVAGFDAAFWLHHANVDRQLALWEAIHPGVWVTPGTQPNGTYTIDDDGKIDVESDLTPFWNSQSTYWKSSEVVDPATFNYSYPDFNGLVGRHRNVVRWAILARIRKLYGSQLQPKGDDPTDPWIEWHVHVKMKKYELDKSYAIEVYLGNTYVGAVSVFTNGQPGNCANCQNNIKLTIEGFVHLNEELLKGGKVSSLEEKDVKPYLTKNLTLKARGRKADGTPINITNDLPSVKAAPFAYTVTPVSEAEPPNIGEPTYHHDVLLGKPGHCPPEKW